MIRLFAAQATVLRNGSPDENQIVQENVAAARKSIFDVVIPVATILIILLSLALLFIVLVGVGTTPIAASILFLFAAQFFLIGVYAKRHHHRVEGSSRCPRLVNM